MTDMIDLYIPTLHAFAMDNIFTGSHGPFRFQIKPTVVKKTQKEVDMESSFLTAAFWHGPFCIEKSTVEGEKAFPMSEEGRLAMKAWLEENIKEQKT